MCYFILYFKPSHTHTHTHTKKKERQFKKLKCKRSLRQLSVWRHSSRFFDHVSVSFLQNKESHKEFLPGEKKSSFRFFSPVYFLIFFLWYFIILFTEKSVLFWFNWFSMSCYFLIVDLRHVFATFLLIVTMVVFSIKVVHNHSKYLFSSFCSGLSTDNVFATFLLIVTTVVFSMKVVHNHSKYLFSSFCSGLSTDLICNNWTRIGILQTNEDFYRDLPWRRNWLRKEVVNLVGFMTSLFFMGSPAHMALLPGVRPV